MERSTKMVPSKVVFNIRTGRCRGRRKHDRSSAEKLLRIKRRLRLVLSRNKELARSLEEARVTIRSLQRGEERHQKAYCLCLLQVNSWMECNMNHINAILDSNVKCIKMITNVLTPGLELTLAAGPEEGSSEDLLQRSLHPPGTRLRTVMEMVEEDDAEEEEGGPEEDKENQEQTFLPSKGPTSPPNEEVDGRSSVAGRASMAASTPLKRLIDVNEHAAAFSSRPKIPRTPEDRDADSSQLELLLPASARMFGCRQSDNTATSKRKSPPSRQKKALKLALPKARRPRTPSPASLSTLRVEKQPANGKGCPDIQHLVTHANYAALAIPSAASAQSPYSLPGGAQVENGPELAQPTTQSLVRDKSRRLQGRPEVTAEAERANAVNIPDQVDAKPPTRRSALKGSNPDRASRSCRLTFVVPNQVPASSAPLSPGEPEVVSTVVRPQLDSHRLTFVKPKQVPANLEPSCSGDPQVASVAPEKDPLTSDSTSRRSLGAGISRKSRQLRKMRSAKGLAPVFEEPESEESQHMENGSELAQPATQPLVHLKSRRLQARPKVAAGAERANPVNVPDQADARPPTRQSSLKGCTTGKASMQVPASSEPSVGDPQVASVEAPEKDPAQASTSGGTSRRSSEAKISGKSQLLQKRGSAKGAAPVVEEPESAESQCSIDNDGPARISGRTLRMHGPASYKEPKLNQKVRRQ